MISYIIKGQVININLLYSNAFLNCNFEILTHIRVIPHPGQLNPVKLWIIHGIPHPVTITKTL